MGAAKLLGMKSLLVDSRLQLVPGEFKGLMDSGSSDCFVNSEFVTRNKIRMQKINPLPLFLIDSTVNCCIDQVVSLPMQFSCRLLCVVECYVIPLDSFNEVVLGYNWLRIYNPAIDWPGNILTLLNRPPAKPLALLVPFPVALAKPPH